MRWKIFHFLGLDPDGDDAFDRLASLVWLADNLVQLLNNFADLAEALQEFQRSVL
jgi:hypothetical protein